MRLLFSFILLTLSACVGYASDWDQWRGSLRNGFIERDTPLPESLAGESLKAVWTAELNEGYSSPVAADGKVFTLETKEKEHEIARAFDLKTGKQLWETSWEGSMKVPFFARKNGSWVRCTPAVKDGFVYFGGIRDELVKLDAATGKEVWRVDFKERHDTKVPTFGFVSSPLIDDGAIYIQAGCAVTKIDAETGEDIWRVLENRQAMFESAFSSPVLATIHGKKQLVVQTRTTLAGLNPENGEAYWKVDVKSFRGMNILTPTVIGNRVFTASYGGGSFLYQIDETEQGQTAKELWNKPDLEGYMGSPLVIDDHIYLHGRDQKLHCIALDSGDIKWTTDEKFGQYWSMIGHENRVLALDQKGELILFDASPEAFTVLSRKEISDESTWAHIGIVDDILLVRGLKSLTALRWGSGE